MIYELSLVAKTELSDDQISALGQIVKDVVSQNEGEVLVEDDWGRLTFAQPTSAGVQTGHFVYFIFKANNEANVELTRRFKINEGHLKHLIIKLGDDENAGDLVKTYKTPFSKKYKGSVLDESKDGERSDVEKDRRKFSRRKTCWFTAKKITADWKDPQTFNWLVNEFGKISPARISSISRKHQRFANTAIKRARQLGIASHLSNTVAQAQ